MYSVTSERVGTPRRRTLSRGISEDESLRNIIREVESSAKRQTFADSRMGSIKKMEPGESQDLPETYSEVLQELRELELQREGLMFQVDYLQDTLEGVEEMLAEARREASDASAELERERQAKRKLEHMVGSLTQEVERLKEERMTISAVPVYSFVRNMGQKGEEKIVIEKGTVGEDCKEDAKIKTELEEAQCVLNKGREAFQETSLSDVLLDSTPVSLAPAPMEGMNEILRTEAPETTAGGILGSFFKKGKVDQSCEKKARTVQSAYSGSSVDSEDLQLEAAEDEIRAREREEQTSESPLAKIQKMVHKTFAHIPSFAGATSPPLDVNLKTPQSSQVDLLPGKEMEASAEKTDCRISQGSPTDDAPYIPQERVSEQASGDDPILSEAAPLDAEPVTKPAGIEEDDTGSSPTEHAPGQKDDSDSKSPKTADSCILS